MPLHGAASGIYVFVDLSRILVEKLVSFFYTADYNDSLDSSDANLSVLQLHARMFALAEQYCIDDLRSLSVE